MVANPFAFAPPIRPTPSDRTAAREEIKDIAGRNFTVVEQAQMNDALKQYGYPIDAILSPPLATTLAKNIQARSSDQPDAGRRVKAAAPRSPHGSAG